MVADAEIEHHQRRVEEFTTLRRIVTGFTPFLDALDGAANHRIVVEGENDDDCIHIGDFAMRMKAFRAIRALYRARPDVLKSVFARLFCVAFLAYVSEWRASGFRWESCHDDTYMYELWVVHMG